MTLDEALRLIISSTPERKPPARKEGHGPDQRQRQQQQQQPAAPAGFVDRFVRWLDE